MSFELPFGYKQTTASANVDAMYGPYISLTAARTNVLAALRSIGRTVGIIESGKIVEYWWQEGTADNQLVKKVPPADQLLQLGETSTTAYRGDRGKIAYEHSQESGNPHGTTFNQLDGKPTTIEGFGITNAYTQVESNNRYQLLAKELTIATSTGYVNNLVIGDQRLIRVTADEVQTILTGVSHNTGIIIQVTSSSVPLVLAHNNSNSDADNRFYLGGRNITLEAGSIATLVKVATGWQLVSIAGMTYFSELGKTEDLKLLATVPGGYAQEVETEEFEADLPLQGVPMTSTDLDLMFPDVGTGFQVTCPSLNIMYKKFIDGWKSVSFTTV